jgi:flagellar protein FliS
MLYDGAIKNLDHALKHLEKRASAAKIDPSVIEKIGKSVIRAQEILTELTVSLDFESGKEIAQNLFTLYSFFNQELLEANISFDSGRIKSVRDMVSELRDSWVAIADSAIHKSGLDQGVGLNIAG